MTRRTRRVGQPPRLPRGFVAHECATEGCTDIATIVVRGPKGCEWALCPQDWRELRRQTLGLLETVRMLDHPPWSQDNVAGDADEASR